VKKGRTSKKSQARRTAHQRKARNASTRSSRTRKTRNVQPSAEMTSGPETSSLDPHANMEAEPSKELAPATQKMDAGDLQSISRVEDSTGESAAELVHEGQDLQAEAVEAIEDSAENDGRARKPHEPPAAKVPKFRDRSRL
jgi:hypothetical protein